MYIIYLIKNGINGKCYVGKTWQKLSARWAAHRTHCKSKYRGCTHLLRAMNKYGRDNFIIEKLDHTEDPQLASWLESFYIGVLRTNARCFGYNLTLGGEGRVGYVVSEETKQKIRQSQTGKHLTKEHVEKLRLSHLGQKAWNLGKRTPPETRNKQRLAKLGKPWTLARRKAQELRLAKANNEAVSSESLNKRINT